MRVHVSREALMGGGGVMGELFLGDSLALADKLIQKYGGRVQCVYMDPPFFTGDLFDMRVRVGEAGWPCVWASIGTACHSAASAASFSRSSASAG